MREQQNPSRKPGWSKCEITHEKKKIITVFVTSISAWLSPLRKKYLGVTIQQEERPENYSERKQNQKHSSLCFITTNPQHLCITNTTYCPSHRSQINKNPVQTEGAYTKVTQAN